MGLFRRILDYGIGFKVTVWRFGKRSRSQKGKVKRVNSVESSGKPERAGNLDWPDRSRLGRN